jgi:molybdopterin biosynthesis enzyme
MLRNLAHADALIRRVPHDRARDVGEAVEIIRLQDL